MRVTAELEPMLRRVSKPARYTGGEWNSVEKEWDDARVRFAFAFPEVYEVGMSNLGLLTLYELVNREPDLLMERVFTPWPDLQAKLRAAGLPLFTLESGRPVREFDLLGFSLPYEQVYTNVLSTLALAGIPLRSEERTDDDPIVIAGGSACYNPEPMAEFIDLFAIGEGEDVLLELLQAYGDLKVGGRRARRADFLRRAATIPGVYVPSFYDVAYYPDGSVAAVMPKVPEAATFVAKRVAGQMPVVTKPIVPFLEVIHDRAALELMRSCPRACRFCQAVTLYRPLRMHSVDDTIRLIDELVQNTGHEEVSLLSLSTADYPHLPELVRRLKGRYPNLKISLPSLRIDAFSAELADALEGKRRTSLTFAPEGGTWRLRDIINKRISDEDIFAGAEAAFSRGWQTLKFYFMVGLPGETMDDVAGIAELGHQVAAMGRRLAGNRARVKVSASTFVPKPHTPFQWAPQNTHEQLRPKHDYLRKHVRGQGLDFAWHDPRQSLIEAILSRGDRRLSRAILRAWEQGCGFDGWSDQFRYETWLDALAECGLDPSWYAHREIPSGETLPWDHIGAGSPRDVLRRQYEFALKLAQAPAERSERRKGSAWRTGGLENLALTPAS